MAAQLYSGRLATGDIDIKLARKVSAVISQAIMKGFGGDLPSLDFSSPDAEMYRNLEKQVYQFSFAKNYEQLKAASLALSQGNKVTPWPEFKDVVTRINNEYNVRFLATEYDTAIGSSQMASRWVQFIDDEVEKLRYQTVGDSRVRPSHQVLNGVVDYITSLFWSQYYPPNGWRCRCEALAENSGQVTPKDKIITPTDVPPMFKRNLAKDGLAFPPDHPYFEHVPDEVLKAADDNNPFIYDQVYKAKKGGSVWASPLHNANEYQDNLAAAKVIADSGSRVILLPELKADTDAQRALRKMVLNKDTKPGKNPDATVDGDMFELKACGKTKSAVHNAIGNASKQADKLIILLPKGLGETNFKRFAKGKLLQLKEKPVEIWIVNNGNLKKFKTKDLL